MAQNTYPWPSSGNIGIATANPVEKLTIAGTDRNVLIGDQTFGGGYNGIWLNGSANALNYNLLSRASDRNLYINRPTGHSIYFSQNNEGQMELTPSGNLGIGILGASSRLAVKSESHSSIASFSSASAANSWIQVSNAISQANLGIGSTGITNGTPYLWSSSDKFDIGNDGDPTIFINGMANGSVGIGTANTYNYKLAVNGTAIFTIAVVKQYSVWADYVFEPSYQLPLLTEIERFVKKHKHLPGIPSAKKIEANGLDLGDNQALLLKKIEELTLYAIEQQRQLEERRQLLNDQDKRNSSLEMRLRKLEAGLQQ